MTLKANILQVHAADIRGWFKVCLRSYDYTQFMAFLLNNQMQIHRGHAEARKALHQWLAYTRCKANEVIKDWAGCEQVDPERLPLAERVNRNHYGENVVNFKRESPALDSMNQQPVQSFSYSIERHDLRAIIADINSAVYMYFYSSATVIGYSEFCQTLEQIKLNVDEYHNINQSVSPYEGDRELLHCHYAFIYAGFGKLEGDIDTGVTVLESVESLQSVILMLSSMGDSLANDRTGQFVRQKVLATLTNAENLHNRMAGLHSLPSMNRSPSK